MQPTSRDWGMSAPSRGFLVLPGGRPHRRSELLLLPELSTTPSCTPLVLSAPSSSGEAASSLHSPRVTSNWVQVCLQWSGLRRAETEGWLYYSWGSRAFSSPRPPKPRLLPLVPACRHVTGTYPSLSTGPWLRPSVSPATTKETERRAKKCVLLRRDPGKPLCN